MTATSTGARVVGARAQGMLVFGLSTVVLTIQDALTKLLTATFAPIEILFYRGLLALAPVLLIVWWSGGRVRLRTARPAYNLTRGLVSLCTSIFVVWTFVYLPLAEGLAIIFLNPLILTALSAPVLGERVSWRQWGAVAVGFLGAMLIIRPTGGAPLSWHVAIPIGAALMGACRDLMTRRLGSTDHPSTVLLYSMTTMFLGSGVLVAAQGTHLPSAHDWLMYVGAALLVTAAYFTQIVGFKLAPAALIAPFKYLSLVWAGLLGWAIWGDVMAPVKFAGCVLVVGSGLYLLKSES